MQGYYVLDTDSLGDVKCTVDDRMTERKRAKVNCVAAGLIRNRKRNKINGGVTQKIRGYMGGG